jgi:hypothetical protein
MVFTWALEDAGIVHQLSAPYAHQQNGKAEHAIHRLEGHLFAMLDAENLPPTLWGEAAPTAAYLWNRSESSSLPPGLTPYKIVNGCKPDLSHLCVFGAKCFAHIPTELQMKLGPHSCHAVFIGYPEGTKGYHLRDLGTGAFFRARDVIFGENLPSLHHLCDSKSDSDSGSDHPNPIQATSSPPQPAAHQSKSTPSSLPVPTPVPAPPSLPEPRCSSRTRTLTPAGQSYSDELTAAKSWLQSLREACLGRTEVAGHKGVTNVPSNWPDTRLEVIAKVEANADVPEGLANAVIEEQANVAIRSNCR